METENKLLVRGEPIEARRAALLVIDVQNWVFAEQARVANTYFQQRLHEIVLPNLQRLIDNARRTGAELIYTVIENLTRDGRDRSLDYKISNIFVAMGSWDAKVIDAIAPGEDDIVLSKTSSSLFNSTNCDYLLRNLGIEHLICPLNLLAALSWRGRKAEWDAPGTAARRQPQFRA